MVSVPAVLLILAAYPVLSAFVATPEIEPDCTLQFKPATPLPYSAVILTVLPVNVDASLVKVKLIYTIELLVFAVIFITIATLKLVRVLPYKELARIIFNWVTIFGGLWIIADFVWLMCSKRRRKKNCVLDKALVLPIGIYIITYDLICLIGPKRPDMFYIIMVSIVLYYAGVIYIFQAIYHYFRPIPSIVQAIEEVERRNAEAEKEEQAEEEKQDEQK